MYILTPEEIRTQEENANANGLPYKQMMLNAGKGCAEKIIRLSDGRKKVTVICGKGNNGGDGYIIASVLELYKYDVTVINAFGEPQGEFIEYIYSALKEKVRVLFLDKEPDEATKAAAETEIVVDAVFGIGFKGKLPEKIIKLFEVINKKNALKFAVDIPSGLTMTDEESMQTCFRADHTLSMLCLKKEHVYKPYSFCCGKISVIPIGFEAESQTGLLSLLDTEIKANLPERPYDANKGSLGHALIVAGSYKMPGAAILATKGALTTGAGLVTLAFPDCCYSAVTSQLSENIMMPLRTAEDGSIAQENITTLISNPKKYSAIAIGCGASPSPNVSAVLTALIKSYPGTLIIDADGINLLAKNIDILKEAIGDIIITPHPGEMSRLNWSTVKEINANREETAEKFAKEFKVTVLLKGHNTVIASPDGRMYINRTGCSALARGGSGDMLTGMIAAFAANGMPPFEAACTGAYMHGLAGEKAAEKYTSYCATIQNVINCIPDAFFQILNGK